MGRPLPSNRKWHFPNKLENLTRYTLVRVFFDLKREKIKMKTILIAGLALGLSTSVAMAEGLPTMPEITFPEVEVSVGAERALEAEVNTLYSSIGIGAITLGTTLEDTATNTGSFNVSKYEFDIEQPLGPNVKLYVENDFTDDFKHSETIVGGKITF